MSGTRPAEVPLGRELERRWLGSGSGNCGPRVEGPLVLYAAQPQVVTDAHTRPSHYPVSIVARDRHDGALRWERRLTAWIRGCPVVASSSVVVATGDGRLHALHAGTGAERWNLPGAWIAGPATNASHVFAADETRGVVALNPTTGRQAWTWSGGGLGRVHLVLADAHTVYVETYRYGAENGSEPREHWTFVALDARDGRELWRSRMDAAFNAPQLTRFHEKVYVVSDRSELFALDATSGAAQLIRTFGNPLRAPAAVTFDDGIFYFYDVDAALVRRLDLKTKRELPPIASRPYPRWLSVQQQHLLLSSDEGLVAHALDTGEPTWRVDRALVPGDAGALWLDDALYFDQWTLGLWASSLSLRIRTTDQTARSNALLELQVAVTSNRRQPATLFSTYQTDYLLLSGVKWVDDEGHSYQLTLPPLPDQAGRARGDYVSLSTDAGWATRLAVPVGPEPRVDGRMYVRDDGVAVAGLPPGSYRLVLSYTNTDASYWWRDPQYGPRVETLDGVWLGRLVSNAVSVRVEK